MTKWWNKCRCGNPETGKRDGQRCCSYCEGYADALDANDISNEDPLPEGATIELCDLNWPNLRDRGQWFWSHRDYDGYADTRRDAVRSVELVDELDSECEKARAAAKLIGHDPDQGVGFRPGEIDSGEIELCLNVEGKCGSVFLSRDIWEDLGRRGGWLQEKSPVDEMGHAAKTGEDSQCPIAEVWVAFGTYRTGDRTWLCSSSEDASKSLFREHTNAHYDGAVCFTKKAETTRLREALSKINAIRNSIVGTQTINWSAHIYPLVSALNEAGFDGQGYEAARAEAKTLIGQRDEALAEAERLRKAINDEEECAMTSGGLLSNVCDVLFSDHRRAISHGYVGVVEQATKLVRERDEALAESALYRERLQFDLGGSDKIDELEAVLDFAKSTIERLTNNHNNEEKK